MFACRELTAQPEKAPALCCHCARHQEVTTPKERSLSSNCSNPVGGQAKAPLPNVMRTALIGHLLCAGFI